MSNNNGQPSIGHVINNRFSRRFRCVCTNDQHELFKPDLHNIVEQNFFYLLVVKASYEAFPKVSYSLGTKVWPIIGDLHYIPKNIILYVLSQIERKLKK